MAVENYNMKVSKTKKNHKMKVIAAGPIDFIKIKMQRYKNVPGLKYIIGYLYACSSTINYFNILDNLYSLLDDSSVLIEGYKYLQSKYIIIIC